MISTTHSRDSNEGGTKWIVLEFLNRGPIQQFGVRLKAYLNDIPDKQQVTKSIVRHFSHGNKFWHLVEFVTYAYV